MLLNPNHKNNRHQHDININVEQMLTALLSTFIWASLSGLFTAYILVLHALLNFILTKLDTNINCADG